MTVIELRAVDAAPANAIETALASIGWLLLSSSDERIIVAPARELFQFADTVPTAVGIYPDRVDSYYSGLKVSVESATTVSLGQQLAQWLSDYLRAETSHAVFQRRAA